ncbi:MAG: ATP-dependent DNA helicase RecQ [Myxococcales bacterium]|nr:ATP-dependent DNA helicase RecQ [Myxococcales bacterium]
MDIVLNAGLERLGYEAFRPGQREAIETLLRDGRLLLVAPTGGGKSLTFQLPASILPGTTLVVSPLIALMHDQVAHLEARGVPATYIASTLDGREISARMAAMARGAYKLVYVAPERLSAPGFRDLIHQIPISLLAIDEAHCISEWGHDFRPEYMQIGELVQSLQTRVLACTATATPIVRDEILARLGLGADTPQLLRGFARPNLALRVAEIGDSKERNRAVDELLREALGAPPKPGSRPLDRPAAIVYAPTRKGTEEEAKRLKKAGWRVLPYHAGLDPDDRERAQRAFIDRSIDIVVATNAFGMGIDRADVRAVIHLAPPSSIEAYYQEVGRAGRDGLDAHGLMLFTARDIVLRRRLIERPSDDFDVDPAVIEHKWGLFLELMRWAEGGSCRHDALLRYFGDEGEALGGCGRCDICQSLEGDDEVDEAEVTLIVRKALSAVARIHRRFGLQAAVRLLEGAADPRLERTGLDRTPTFGALRDHDPEWLTRLLRRCVTAGWVDFTGDERPVAMLTEAGRRVMKAEAPARLLLPSTGGGGGGRPRTRGKRPAPPEVALDPAANLVFEALRAHRLDVAKAEGVPPYVIASDRSLRDIALLRPRNLDELKMAHGIGPSKAERYGPGLLAVVAAGA